MRATLVKLVTDDGLMEVEDDVPLGRTYEVDPATRRTVELLNVERGVTHVKEVVDVDDGTFFPTELLRIEEPS